MSQRSEDAEEPAQSRLHRSSEEQRDELQQSLEIQSKESSGGSEPLLSSRLRGKQTAADQSVINTVVLVHGSSFRLVFEVELNDKLMNTSVTLGLRR